VFFWLQKRQRNCKCFKCLHSEKEIFSDGGGIFYFINFNNVLDLFTNGGNRSCLFLELLMGESMNHRCTQGGEGGKGDDIGPQ
jgi:hypothetical protein